MDAIYGTLRQLDPVNDAEAQLVGESGHSATEAYRFDIDGLRAIAVIPVVLFHVGFATFSGGFVGVDIFFVISGYLITSTLIRDLERGQYSVARFYERRIRRILPALFAMLLLTSIMAVILFLPENLAEFGKSLASSALFGSNFFFWASSGDYFAIQAAFRPLLHTWSLSVEEQFYIFFPLILAGAAGLQRKPILPMIVLLLATASLCMSIYATRTAAVANFYLLPTRAWELLAGSILAFGTFSPLRSRIASELQALTGILLIGAAVFLYSEKMPFPGLAAIPPVAGSMLVINAGTGQFKTNVAKLLEQPPLRFIGLISYSLYLWHWPIIVFARYYWLELDQWMMLAIVPASIMVATLSWRLVERPFRTSGAILNRSQLFGLTSVLIAAAALSGFALAKHDIPGRVPSDIRRMASKSTYHGRWRECGGSFKRQRTLNTLCVLGAANVKPDLLLVGDSHAEAVAATVFETAASVGDAGYQITDTGFRPLIGYRKFGEQEKYSYLTKLTLDLLESHPEISRVVIPIYWRQAVLEDQYIDAQGRDVAGQDAVENGLRTLITHYPRKQFLIILSPANSATFGGNAAARAAWFGHRYEPHIPRAEFDNIRARYQMVVDGLARLPNVSLFDLSTKLCDDRFCYGTIGDKIAYADDNHISYYASKSLIPDLIAFYRNGR